MDLSKISARSQHANLSGSWVERYSIVDRDDPLTATNMRKQAGFVIAHERPSFAQWRVVC